jgi:uncharacterized protein
MCGSLRGAGQRPVDYVRVVNESRHCVLGGRIRVADTLASRMRGFLFHDPPSPGEGLFLAPCRGVQTYWLRYALDVILLNDAGEVVAAHELPPGRCTPIYRSARFALELPAGAITASRTAVGDRLSWKPATNGR